MSNLTAFETPCHLDDKQREPNARLQTRKQRLWQAISKALRLTDTDDCQSAEKTIIVCKHTNVLVRISVATTQALQLDSSPVDHESCCNVIQECLILFHCLLGDLFPSLDLSVDD